MASVVITVLAAALIVFAVYQTVQKARGKSKMASCCGSGLGKKEADVLSKLPRTEEDFAMALANTCYKVSGCTETA